MSENKHQMRKKREFTPRYSCGGFGSSGAGFGGSGAVGGGGAGDSSCYEKMRGRGGQGERQGEKPNLACTFFPQIHRIMNRSELLNPVFVHKFRLTAKTFGVKSRRFPLSQSYGFVRNCF